MRLSDLTDKKKQHLAWRLDNKTGCGLLTACAVARGDHGDLELVDIFVQYGGRSLHSAKIHARKVINFRVRLTHPKQA
jgi:hypothetical protein